MTEAGDSRAGDDRLAELKAEADHARRRYELYKARTYGPRPTSPNRLAQRKRDSDRAAGRLSRAQSDAQLG